MSIRSELGFTMIELIIVIAIIGILSAILVPSFTSLSRKSKLRADISTLKQVQTQIDLFMTEHEGIFPGGKEPAAGPAAILPIAAVDQLVADDYIKASNTVDSQKTTIRVQSKNATVLYNAKKEHLELKVADNELLEAKKMAVSDKEWINGE
ncbi:MAG TPA: prepilin-type N-terminal cleavage/methylation domain-containing protein [Epulopiscium sp.]|nr:prepilin-type N-terminal cleavage/methylation domain-containing protein [Candidatus Epulonipiscium sp.]